MKKYGEKEMQEKSTQKGRDKLPGNIKKKKEKKERREKENPGIKK